MRVKCIALDETLRKKNFVIGQVYKIKKIDEHLAVMNKSLFGEGCWYNHPKYNHTAFFVKVEKDAV